MRFTDDVTVELLKSNAHDADVIWAARVSTAGQQTLHRDNEDPDESRGLIRFLMRNKHGTPFEHGSLTFFVKAPIFVFREFHRHRVGWSYNEESGRYKQLDPEFYIPKKERPLQQTGKPGHYQYIPGSDMQYVLLVDTVEENSTEAYDRYQKLLDAGVAKEIARSVLPVNIFSSMYATCNPRSLMAFLSLRTHDENAAFVSHPQHEIELVARKMEKAFAQQMPVTYQAWNDFGRVSP